MFCKSQNGHEQSWTAGVTLMELLVAVSIFAIGIVALIHSFLSAVSALDSVNNRFAALQYLEGRINNVELTLMFETGILPEGKEEPINLGVREALFRMNISPLEAGTSGDVLNKVAMSVIWQENRIAKNESVVFLVPNKK